MSGVVKDHQSESFRPDIEGLRAIAILLVVLFHVGIPGFSGGFVGVDVFFVLSGFLITRLLVAEARTSGTISLSRFWARRARRLLPASAVMLLVVVVLAALVMPPLALPDISSAALGTSLYVSNFYFAYQSTDYLATGLASNPLLHHWSLAVEEQFYFLWPLLMLGAARIRGRTGSDRPFLYLAGLVFAGSLALSLWLTGVRQPWAFFGSPARGWEFAAGALVVALTPWLEALPAGARALSGWVGAGVLAFASVWISRQTPYPGTAALLPVVGTCCLIASGMGRSYGRIGRFLSTAPMGWLGKLSYSWYLWHWPALIFTSAVVVNPSLVIRIGAVLVALLVSDATYHLVENPIRFNRRLASAPWLSLGLGGAMMAVCLASSGSLRVSAGHRLDQPTQRQFARAFADIPVIYGNGCHVGFSDTLPASCVYGDTMGTRTVILFGDSHAAEWFPALDLLGRAHGWRVIPFTKSACPSVSAPVYAINLEREYWECDRWRVNTLIRISQLKPDLVLLSNDDHQDVVIEGRPRVVDLEPEATALWRSGLVHTIQSITAAGGTVGLLRDTPHPLWDIPRCLSQHERAPDRCGIRRALIEDSTHTRMEHALAASTPGVILVNLTDHICRADYCPAMADSMVLFRDDSHLTGEFVQTLAPELLRQLPPALGGGGVTLSQAGTGH